MNAQEIFTTVYTGVVTQGALAKDDTGACLYRGPDGTKCGVGHLIDDELAASIEDLSIEVVDPLLLPLWAREQLFLLEQIQRAHDKANNIEDFQIRMTRLAEELNLKVPTL